MLRPRLTRAALTGAALSLVLATDALAAGGGGSSGFSGGGGGGFSGGGGGGFSGGGGGGFSGGGGGYSGGGGGGFGTVIFGLLLLYVLFLGLQFLFRKARYGAGVAQTRWWGVQLSRKRDERRARVHTAAAEAAEDDAAFAADLVEARGKELFMAVQLAWDRRDEQALAALVSPSLLAEWQRRLRDFERKGWHNRVKLLQEPDVSYVGLTNRQADEDDRAVVLIQCRLEDYVQLRSGREIFREGARSKAVDLVEFWTLAKRDGTWALESIELGKEGAHQLEGAIVATPWADDDRLRDEAVAERAAAEALPAGMSPAEVADLDFDGPARSAAQDLALADGRFDPALIEASVRRAVDGWVTAVDGPDDALASVARPEALDALLHPGDTARKQRRLVVRGPQLESITITALDAAATPATITVEIAARGRRYMEDRDTAAVLSGSREREVSFVERWTLALDGEGEWPWRIAGVTTPANA